MPMPYVAYGFVCRDCDELYRSNTEHTKKVFYLSICECIVMLVPFIRWPNWSQYTLLGLLFGSESYLLSPSALRHRFR